MAINFETVTGNQTSANVLTQINNNFAKINSTPVSNADFATNADTVDNKHASELIPGAAIFLDSITSLDDLSVGRYFCTQTEQSWEPVTTTGSRTFLIEVSLDIPNNLKSYKINYIAGEGAGESYYSDYSNGSIRWNRVVTNGNIENLLSIYNYLIFNNIKMQPVLVQDGFYMIENKKTNAKLITDDGTKYFIISYSGNVVTIEMYNFDTDELLATQTTTHDSTISSIQICYSDNSIIIFYVQIGSVDIGYIATFSENSITIEYRETFSFGWGSIYTLINSSLSYGVHDGRYSNDNYIVGGVGKGQSYESAYFAYNKLTKTYNTAGVNMGYFAYNSYNMYPTAERIFLSRNANIFCGIGDEKGTYNNHSQYRPGGFIKNIDTGSLIRLQLSSIHSYLDIALNSSAGTNYGGVVIVGNFVYVSANFKYGSEIKIPGIFKFNVENGAYIGQIPYEKAGSLKLAYQDEKTILCVENNNIFEIDVDTFTIKNKYNGQPYILNPSKTEGTTLVSPCVLNDKYHKIAVNKKVKEGGVSKIDYYVGYEDYWLAIGGV